MKKYIVLSVMMLLVGCAQREVPMENQADPTATITSITITPTTELPINGPYFAYIKKQNDQISLIILGNNNVGKKQITFPKGARVSDCLSCIISPDGKWIVYWMGTSAGEEIIEGPHDLSINLLNIDDGSTRQISTLLSGDYPNNFEEQYKYLNIEDPDFYPFIKGSFTIGIESARWSPDGKKIVFAGEMDGPTSDLYIYDIDNQNIKRLTYEMTNIFSDYYRAIEWSPNGEWILYLGASMVGTPMSYSYYAVASDGSIGKELVRSTGGSEQSREKSSIWISPTTFLLFKSSNGVGAWNLQSINIESGEHRTLWESSCNSYDDDLQYEILAISSDVTWPNASSLGYGLYFMNPFTGDTRILLEITHGEIRFVGQEHIRFIFSGGVIKGNNVLNTTIAITAESKMITILDVENTPFISNDKKWIALAGYGIKLLDNDMNITDIGFLDLVDAVYWQPDSKAIFFISEGDLYYYNLLEAKIIPIDNDVSNEGETQYYWIFT